MHYQRKIKDILEQKIKNNPITALLGPRQCGKSTLAKEVIQSHGSAVYIDLEDLREREKLRDLWAFLEANEDGLICFDEVQLLPEIFSQLRVRADRLKRNGQFLLLGSASKELIQKSSESLAGRISYQELSPFRHQEVSDLNIHDLWLRGGFPRSLLADDLDMSVDWRLNFIKTYLEQDLPQLGFRIPSSVLSRFWTMCAHYQGQVLNQSKMAEGFGLSANTIKNYLHILEETYMLRLLKPYYANTKKRLVKSPKLYLRDSGLVHTLLRLDSYNDLLGHPVKGFSFEGFVIEELISLYSDHEPYFYRSAVGDEIDLVLEKGGKKKAFEIKASTAPRVESGFWRALDHLEPDEAYIVADVKEVYSYQKDVDVIPFNLKNLNRSSS